MTLQQIEQVVLNNIGMRYDELSISTDAKEILDFAMLHTCINLAREEIKLNTNIPALMMLGTAITTIANQSTYSLPTDFDIPVKIFYESSSSSWELEQLYVSGLSDTKILTTIDPGTPSKYLILGTSANLIQIILVTAPNIAGDIFAPIYKPVLTTLSLSTAEDIIMRKYPKTVIDFATAFAFQILKKDKEQHDKYYGLGLAECAKIDLRETNADSNFRELPPPSIRDARSQRLSR